jgi:hemoglobin
MDKRSIPFESDTKRPIGRKDVRIMRESKSGLGVFWTIKSLRIGQIRIVTLLLQALVLGLVAGCASPEEADVVSGSAAADQRASEIVAKDGKKNGGKREQAVERTLYERLGGEPGIHRIVDDFINRALEDPRVNWTRKGVKKGGLLRRDRPVEWQATEDSVARLKKHFVEFFSVASGGPAQYTGKAIRPAHADMRIVEAEFEAAIGDLKASLDHLKIPADLQKDVIAIFESTRPLIVVKQ